MNQLSYRDPDGFVIRFSNRLYRVILKGFEPEAALLTDTFYADFNIPVHSKVSNQIWKEIVTSLSSELTENEILVILEIEELSLITYPWEWTPSMLIDAGIYTLQLQKKLMERGLSLKDATFFNIQFANDKIFFIDLLSLKREDNFYPWIPFGQFLRHFIYPAALLKYNKISDLKILWSNTDGINFKHLQRNLPKSSFFNFYELLHFKVNALLINESNAKQLGQKTSADGSISKLNNLIDWNISYLEKIKLKLKKKTSYWAAYYQRDVSTDYNQKKTDAINALLGSIHVEGNILDIGANTGEYSELFVRHSNNVISVEKDAECCEIIRQKIIDFNQAGDTIWHVINADIINPDPGLGWMNKERSPLLQRIKSELVCALGITHHIYFTDSIDFNQQVLLFENLTIKYLIVEFITADDDKVKRISVTNQNRMPGYTSENFVNAFSKKFNLLNSHVLIETRELFLFQKR